MKLRSLAWHLLVAILSVGCHAPQTKSPTTAPADTQIDDADSVEFFGIRDHGRRIVYITEATGNMINSWSFVGHELCRSLGDLHPTQSLNVLLMYGGDFKPLSKHGPIPATPENRRVAKDYVENLATTGTSDSLGALLFALNEKPDIIYWLDTDDFSGYSLDNRAAIKQVIAANKDHRTRIHVIGWASSRKADLAFTTTLRLIAETSNGTYKTVFEDEFPN